MRQHINDFINWYEQPFRFSRTLAVIGAVVGLGLVIFCTLTGTPLIGQPIILALVGASGGGYAVRRAIHTYRARDTEDI